MRIARYQKNGRRGLALAHADAVFRGVVEGEPNFPGEFDSLLANNADTFMQLDTADWNEVDLATLELLPPVTSRAKIFCVGLNYVDHAAETRNALPAHPVVFTRFETSVVGASQSLQRPPCSDKFDFEGEVAIIIGKSGRRIDEADALDHVLGYALFNDATIRDYQKRTSQWALGKNFDRSGSFGPFIVTADEVPRGLAGLRLQTRLNGEIVQDASTDDMIFGVARLIAEISEAVELAPGDVIVSGTPSGVGMARTPPLWMRPGDIVEVECTGLGVLQNPIIDEPL